MRKMIKICIIIAGVISCVAYAINWAFFDIQRISGQEYLNKSTSPNGTYTVSAYLNNGGATMSFAVLGTLKNNNNGKDT